MTFETATEVVADPVTENTDFQSPDTPSLETGTPETSTDSNSQVIEDWMQDGRYQKGMWKSPNDLYKSIKELEPRFHQTNTELNQLKKWKQEVEPKVGEYDSLSQYKQQTDPLMSVLTKAYQDPVLASRMDAFLSELDSQLKRKEFGDLPDEVIQQIVEIRRDSQETKEKLRSYEEKAQLAEYSAKAMPVLESLDAQAKEIGIEFDQLKFLDECQKYGVTNPDLMDALFQKLYQDQLKDFYIKSAQDELRKKSAPSSQNMKIGNKKLAQSLPETDPKNPKWLDNKLSQWWDSAFG